MGPCFPRFYGYIQQSNRRQLMADSNVFVSKVSPRYGIVRHQFAIRGCSNT